jgi:hypothetical protein
VAQDPRGELDPDLDLHRPDPKLCSERVQQETRWLTGEIQLQFATIMAGEMALLSKLVGFEREKTEKERARQRIKKK